MLESTLKNKKTFELLIRLIFKSHNPFYVWSQKQGFHSNLHQTWTSQLPSEDPGDDIETVTENMEQVRDIIEDQIIIEDGSGRSTTIVDLSYLPILGSFLLGINKI